MERVAAFMRFAFSERVCKKTTNDKKVARKTQNNVGIGGFWAALATPIFFGRSSLTSPTVGDQSPSGLDGEFYFLNGCASLALPSSSRQNAPALANGLRVATISLETQFQMAYRRD